MLLKATTEKSNSLKAVREEDQLRCESSRQKAVKFAPEPCVRNRQTKLVRAASPPLNGQPMIVGAKWVG